MDTQEIKQAGQTAIQEVSTSVHDHLAALGHKHATVTFATLGAGVLVLTLMIGGGLLALKSFDASLSRADANNTALIAQLKTDGDKIKTLDNEIQNLSTLQAQKVVVIDTRDKKTNKDIGDVTRPDKTAEEVAADSKNYLGALPTFTPDKKLAFEIPQVQGFVALKIDRDRLFADYTDEKSLLTFEQAKTVKLTDEKKTLQVDKDAAIKNLDDYKKLAHKSKFKVFLGGAEKVAIFVGGVYFGKKL